MEGEHQERPPLINRALRDWVINIGEELEERRPRQTTNRNGATSSPIIFRVPPHLLGVSETSYTPKIFPFGLYGLHDRKISRLDDQRTGFASIFKGIVGIRRWSRICAKVVGSVTSQVWLYDEVEPVPEQDMDAVKNLLCLDAVFQVCFIQGRHQGLCKTCGEKYPTINEVMHKEPLWSRRNLVLFDIFLFQNQIPLELLRNVVDLMSDSEKTRRSMDLSYNAQRNKSDEEFNPLLKIVRDAVELVYCNLPGFVTLKETIQKTSFGDCKHLLHCLYQVVCYDPKKTPLKTPSQQVEHEKADPGPVLSASDRAAAALPVEMLSMRSKLQVGKDVLDQSHRIAISSAAVAPTPSLEIIEDRSLQESPDVTFKSQTERVHFLFRGEHMARLFPPEERLFDVTVKELQGTEEGESNDKLKQKSPQHPEHAAAAGPIVDNASQAQPVIPLQTPPIQLDATQQAAATAANSASTGTPNAPGRVQGPEMQAPAPKTKAQLIPVVLSNKSTQAAEGVRVLPPDGEAGSCEHLGKGKEKIITNLHRLPEPGRIAGSNPATIRPWTASPQKLGDLNTWSFHSDRELSSPGPPSQVYTRSARGLNNSPAPQIGCSNLDPDLNTNADTLPRRKRSSWCCCCGCMHTGEAEDMRHRRRKSTQVVPGVRERNHRIPTLTELKRAGIQVAVGTTRYISEVSFRTSMKGFRGTLYLPAFEVFGETEGLLRNLVTYEQVVEKKNDLLSYIYFMHNLIDTEDDVALLIQRGVIRANNLDSNRMVSDMWSTLLTGHVITLNPHYQKLFENISEHCAQISNARFKGFRQLYLARPGLIRGVVLAVLMVLAILMALIVATVFTVVSYYHRNK